MTYAERVEATIQAVYAKNPSKLRVVSFAEFNSARRAIARALDLLDADALEFSVDGEAVIVRHTFGKGSL